MTSTASRGRTESSFLGVARVAALIVALVGAAGSFGLMLHAARHQESVLLKVLFTGWVLAPFAALAWACVVAKRWAMSTQKTLYSIMVLTTACSLAVYGSLVLGTLRAKNGFIFLVVPSATWLLIAIAFGLAVLMRRRIRR